MSAPPRPRPVEDVRPSVSGELVYFLHIPKTSGSSVREFFVRLYGADRVTPVLVWDNLIAGDYRIDERIQVIGGHFGGLLPIWLRRWPTIVTMLRHPLARAVSHINHVQHDTKHLLHREAAGLSVLQYCERPALRKTIENFQSRYLASLSFAQALVPPPAHRSPGRAFGDHAVRFENALYALDREAGLQDAALAALDAIDAVGLCEAHRPSLQLFAHALGRTAGADIGESRVNVASAGWTLEGLSKTDVAALTDLNAGDLAVYRRASRKFVEDCGGHGIALDPKFVEEVRAS